MFNAHVIAQRNFLEVRNYPIAMAHRVKRAILTSEQSICSAIANRAQHTHH